MILHWQTPYWLTIPCAGLLAGALGFLFGLPALRLSGIHLALATFALAVSTPQVLKKWTDLTHGSRGIRLAPCHGCGGLPGGPWSALPPRA